MHNVEAKLNDQTFTGKEFDDDGKEMTAKLVQGWCKTVVGLAGKAMCVQILIFH